jgi:hypothetical protein
MSMFAEPWRNAHLQLGKYVPVNHAPYHNTASLSAVRQGSMALSASSAPYRLYKPGRDPGAWPGRSSL